MDENNEEFCESCLKGYHNADVCCEGNIKTMCTNETGCSVIDSGSYECKECMPGFQPAQTSIYDYFCQLRQNMLLKIKK